MNGTKEEKKIATDHGEQLVKIDLTDFPKHHWSLLLLYPSNLMKQRYLEYVTSMVRPAGFASTLR